MRYRIFKYVNTDPYEWKIVNGGGTEIKINNNTTIAFFEGGAVSSYEIDDDYIIGNNSNITIAKESKAVAGQPIALIKDSGAYHLGVIVAVDNEKKSISYKSFIDVFNDNITNPNRREKADENISYQYDGINDTAAILAQNFAGSAIDKYRRLPIVIRTSGGGKTTDGTKYNVSAIWSDTGDQINVKSWLIDLFEKQNVIIQPRLVFETDRAYIELFIYQNTTSGKLIKKNIKSLTLENNETQSSSATVCVVLRKDKSIDSKWYLLDDNTVTENSSASNRIQPYREVTATWDNTKTNKPGEPITTAKIIAEEQLKYKEFSNYISLTIDKKSYMDYVDINVGDAVRIIPKIEDMNIDTPLLSAAENKKRIIKSVLTGIKETSKSSRKTYIFGKIRVLYTDIIQMENAKKVRG